MNISFCSKRNAAITLLDILAVIVVFGVLLAVLSRRYVLEKNKAQRIHCTNNLKQIGSSFNSWADLYQGTFPTFLYDPNGSPMEFDSGPNAWRHFRIASLRLLPPRFFICPADSERSVASNYISFNNSNVSYFVGLPKDRSVPGMLIAGDRNITNGTPLKDGILELTASQPGGWTRDLHNQIGNFTLADGSVQQASRSTLQQTVTSAGTATNRLLMPILP